MQHDNRREFQMAYPFITVSWQITGCYNTPKYGQQKGPLKFCQQHKRVGMYTNRNGQRLLATRDGSGESVPHTFCASR